MRSILAVSCVLILVAGANALTVNYGYEDGGTILGSYGNVADPTNVTGEQSGSSGTGTYTCPGAYEGERYLHVAEDPHASTPQVYLAYIENLVEGDVVDASFYGYDITSGSTSPSLRIWGHWANNGDVMSYVNSANGNNTYTDGSGWSQLSWSWTVPAGMEALVVEARLYSSPATGPNRTDYWIDALSVTAPDHASISVPEPATLALLAFGGLFLTRRR